MRGPEIESGCAAAKSAHADEKSRQEPRAEDFPTAGRTIPFPRDHISVETSRKRELIRAGTRIYRTRIVTMDSSRLSRSAGVK